MMKEKLEGGVDQIDQMVLKVEPSKLDMAFEAAAAQQ